MKKGILLSLGVLLTMAGEASGWYWPPASTEILPASPSSSDVVTITLSGEWPNNCIPNDSSISAVSNGIYFDVILNYPPGTMCLLVITPWSTTEYIGPLSPGTYTVYARLLGDPSVPETYTPMTEIVVAEACTDQDEDGYGSPASGLCFYPELDCDDDPTDDPAECPSQGGSCACGEASCAGCAKCINPGAKEGPYSDPTCSDDIDNDCDGGIDDPTSLDNCSYPGAANAEASAYGGSSLTTSGSSNSLALFLVPVGAVILLRFCRKKK